MNLWSLLLPFKWLIIGVGEAIKGVFVLVKKSLSLFGSLLTYLFKGVVIISRGIGYFLKNIFFKYLFISIKWSFEKLWLLFMLLLRGLKIVIVYSFKGLMVSIEYLIMIVKFISIYLYKGVSFIVKYLYLGIRLILKYIYIALKTMAIFLYKIFKTVAIYVGRALKFIFVDIIYKYLKAFFTFVLGIIIKVLNFLAKVPDMIWRALQYIGGVIYKTVIAPIIRAYKKMVRIVNAYIQKLKKKLDAFAKKLEAFPKKSVKFVVDKFNNLSFVKDLKNRSEMQRQTLLIDFNDEDAVRSEKKITFSFVAKNSEGKIEKGRLSAFSKLDVHSFLLAEGYEVYKIEPMKGLNAPVGGITRRIKISDLVFFLTQLSTYIKSGLPLVESIKILSKQTKKGNIRALYKAIIYDLTMGESFSEALEKQGNSFPKLLVNMVKSSELAGNLSETLDDMAEYYTSVSKTRKQMKSAMTYPTVILVFAMCVVVFILTFVIPSFIQMYKDADAEVPALTTAVIGLSDFLVANALWLVLGVGAIIVGLYYMYKNIKVFRLLVQWILMHLPIVGNIIIYNEVTMFSKTFASLWNHNVFITSSMEILSKITNNEIYKMLIFDAITNVARGEPVSGSFKNHWAFPIVAYEMLVTGERTGQPGPMMDKVSDFYQEEHRNAVNQVKAFIEPALIIVLAVVVGVILLSVILPMFSIYGQLGLE